MKPEILKKLFAGEPLTRREAHSTLAEIMAGKSSPERIAAFLTALRVRGETYEEIAGMAGAMRAASVRIQVPEGVVVDTCGTGGDGANTINISTAAAFVASTLSVLSGACPACTGFCGREPPRRCATCFCDSSLPSCAV